MATKRFATLVIALAGVFAVASLPASDSALAGVRCDSNGAWFGVVSGGSTWMMAVSPGSDATDGAMVIEWVSVDPTLGFFPTAVRWTNAVGPWQKVGEREAAFTHVNYALDATGATVYVFRVSGISRWVSCDRFDFTYVAEVFLPGQDMTTEPPLFCLPGTGTTTRMPLVQATCAP